MTRSKIIRFAWTLLFAAALAVIGGRPSLAEQTLSGVYINTTRGSAELVSLVQTADGRIVGRIESATVDRTGSINRSSITVEGAGDQGTVLLRPQSVLAALASSLSFTGVVDENALELSWPGGLRSYRRGTVEQFQSAVAELEILSGEVMKQQAVDDASSNLMRLTDSLDEIEARLPDLHRQLASASQRYRDLFPRFHNRRRTRAALSAIPDQGLATMRAGTDASSYALDIDAVGLEITGYRNELQRHFEGARSLAGPVNTHCSQRRDNSANLCRELAVQLSRLDRLSLETRAGFEAVEATYREAAVEVPPVQRWLGNATGRSRR